MADDFKQTTLLFNLDKITNRSLVIENKTNRGFEHLNRTISKFYKKPLIVNTHHGKFVWPEIFLKDSKLSSKDKLIRKANKTGVIFAMWEPLCFYSATNYNLKLSFYNEFKSGTTDLFSLEIDDIVEFCTAVGLTNYEILICDYDYHSILASSYPNIKITYDDIFLKTLMLDCDLSKSTLEKRFICPNARYTPHRHLIMTQLAKYNGHYSWNFNCDENLLKEIAWFDSDYDTMSGNRILNEKHFKMDVDIPKDNVQKLTEFKSTDTYVNKSNNNLFYKQSFCAVVNETRYAQPFVNYSEKILKPMSNMIPFVLVAPPYTLELIKSHGYKTFDNWWDESYDLEEDHTKRLLKIFNVIEFIGNLSQSEIIDMYDEMQDVLLHNLNLVKSNPLLKK
jgi:hypothetical protein